MLLIRNSMLVKKKFNKFMNVKKNPYGQITYVRSVKALLISID